MRNVAVCLLAVLALTLAGSSGAASFDDSKPCPVQGQLFVCPAATVGVPYNLQMVGRTGCDLYWFQILGGRLPLGLSMSRPGLITGTPTTTETQTPWLQIHDLLFSQGGFNWCAGDNTSERQFSFRVGASAIPPPALLWYWRLSAGSVLLHSERAVTYADGSTGLGKMLTWEQTHRDVIRVAGRVLLAHVQA
jgi:hypothetical protein